MRGVGGGAVPHASLRRREHTEFSRIGRSIMPHTPWFISAVQFGSCNCDYGYPCQFESKPTHGDCRGFEASEIVEGHFGAVRLDGLRFAMLYAWPGPIYEGKGEMQAVI